MKTRNFNCRGSRWNEITADDNKSMQKSGYVVIKRQPSQSIMAKNGGQMATAIDVKPSELPNSVRSIADDIVRGY